MEREMPIASQQPRNESLRDENTRPFEVEARVTEKAFLDEMMPVLESVDPEIAITILARASTWYELYTKRGSDITSAAGALSRANQRGAVFQRMSPAAQCIMLFLRDLETDPALKGDAARHLRRIEDVVILGEALPRLEEQEWAILRASTPQALERKARAYLETITRIAEDLPPENEEYWPVWRKLAGHFELIPRLKEAVDTACRAMLDEMLDDYTGTKFFSEWVRAATSQGGSVEHASEYLLRRSSQEIARIKTKNRRMVVLEIHRSSDAGEECSIGLIERLHNINNQGLIPDETSQHRGRSGEEVAFGRRMGTLSAHVERELQDVVDRANAFFDRAITTGMSWSVYEIGVAKLHNDFLDMHPFPDRNGSTAMLFMEWMMARRGKMPDIQRTDVYYDHLKKILPDTALARGVVATQHVKTKHLPGYYKGVENVATPKGRREHDNALARLEYRRMLHRAKRQRDSLGEEGIISRLGKQFLGEESVSK